MKHTVDQVGGHEPWEIEVSIWIEKKGLDPDVARFLTIGRWMCNGDLRPLSAAIRNHEVDPAVLSLLAEMIDDGRLSVRGRRRGRRRPPDTFSRDWVAQRLYEVEIAAGKTSDEALDEVARQLPATRESVRKAVTLLRKASEK